MRMFNIDEDLMINLDNIDFVRFSKVKGVKTVVAGIRGEKIVIPEDVHKSFFVELVALGAKPNKQFVSL